MNPHELAERYGTPAYVYDLAAVRAAYADLRAALPDPALLYYSLKANPHPALVDELASLGCRAEVSSTGEVDAALAAGVDPAAVLLTGPGKTTAAVAHALRRGVRRFSVDSPADLNRVGAAVARHGTRAQCLLRVNADEPVSGMGLAMTGTASQFGADASWVLRRPEDFRGSPQAPVTGLHLYMGSNLTDTATLLRQFEVAVAIAVRVRKVLGDLTEIDLGGGFGTPYARDGARPTFPDLADRLARLLDDRLPDWRDGAPRISFESGRYLVGDCGTLLCRVVDVKSSKGQLFTVLDTGVNHLGGMAGLRRLPPILPSVRPPVDRDDTPTEVVRTGLVGPLCTPLDTFSRTAELPAPRPGTLLAVPNVGAYGLTASLLAFLGHPAPVEVVVDGDTPVSVSRLLLDRVDLPVDQSAAVPSGR
ncbi:type III PLP-dependent enzyme [Micromonospora psammae]|uniref:type III PLP-dependent enzyme n=1 Tax=Micromonospora sp. CPCC 205556 TaxID=3122398 RepID=UPI002FF38F04